jgi:hypothetical protein
MGHSDCQSKFLLEMLEHSFLMTSIWSLSMSETGDKVASPVLDVPLLALVTSCLYEYGVRLSGACLTHGDVRVFLLLNSQGWNGTRPVKDYSLPVGVHLLLTCAVRVKN